ncbi:Rne/Rng family ribonuclease [Porphyromonas levii]|uniref:Rne/Rng family ribonuclease n=1 Tax=Porphyromonas levii TaxID=28114 RepID=A0A4Y8WMP3_9PORP|nr:Rne/Rng family ribonuclease [Porphyromonas levii]MBR8702871.1 Ribonuclease G [Porphyromonas levii]MBR8712575.1 Ribonuclease G [Porphyromonas levii]MBR8714567.1 Ribonuclease G [Porphyromonas levii]MBR8727152.1 Ribonuclease G [Porphyromonas levii]MBR8729821.1 Ribonuclease G [Porphyromonas levii]
MKSELIIDVRPKEVSIAVLEDKRLVELQREKQNIAYSVGDIYLGRVKKIMPGLNAAFVDIGHKKEAFLHYRDLGASFRTAKIFIQAQRKYGKGFSPERVRLEKEIDKAGAIADMLQQGDELMVQITKEAISTKGPRVSSELSFAGRYLVLIPFADKVSVSQKIRAAEERQRLKQLILSIKPTNVSVIVRTSAEGVKVAELDHELRSLVKKWQTTVENLGKEPEQEQPKGKKGKQNNKPAVWMLHQESTRLLSLLRDTYSSSFKEIWINDKSLVQETADYIDLIDPGHGNIVKLYEGQKPIFDYYEVSRQIKHLFGKTVTYKSGAYLVIEQTEAMHVVDVNSGNRSRGSKEQEETAVDVNLSAAEEIARQMRLRDLGGIIIIDFIDMAQAANRQKLFEHMNEYMRNDRAKHTILPITKFGLMQITRQRVRQATKIETEEVCPTCHGKGQVQPTIFFTDQVEEMVRKLANEEKINKFALHLHPYVAAYLTKKKGFLGGSILTSWRSKYGKGINVIPDESLGMLDYEFYDSDKNELSYLLEPEDDNEREDKEDLGK